MVTHPETWSSPGTADSFSSSIRTTWALGFGTRTVFLALVSPRLLARSSAGWRLPVRSTAGLEWVVQKQTKTKTTPKTTDLILLFVVRFSLSLLWLCLSLALSLYLSISSVCTKSRRINARHFVFASRSLTRNGRRRRYVGARTRCNGAHHHGQSATPRINWTTTVFHHDSCVYDVCYEVIMHTTTARGRRR